MNNQKPRITRDACTANKAFLYSKIEKCFPIQKNVFHSFILNMILIWCHTFPEDKCDSQSALTYLKVTIFFGNWFAKKKKVQPDFPSAFRLLFCTGSKYFYSFLVSHFIERARERERRGQFYQCFTTSFYAHKSQKRQKDSQVKQLFALSWSARVKADELMKLTQQGVDFINQQGYAQLLCAHVLFHQPFLDVNCASWHAKFITFLR